VLDGWFGTTPWLNWLFTGLGFVAGVLNVYRTLSRTLAETRKRTPPPDRA